MICYKFSKGGGHLIEWTNSHHTVHFFMHLAYSSLHYQYKFDFSSLFQEVLQM